MRLENLLSTFAVVAVAVVSVGFLAASEPEESRITSADGVVTVAGLARQTQPLAVAASTAVKAPLLGDSYTVTPDGVTLDEAAVIGFKLLPEQVVQAESLGVYRFHQPLAMWEPVSPVVANTNQLLAVETRQLGNFALGNVPAFKPPVFANVYDELRAKAPADAVGYETAVGFTELDHELIRLPELGESGGCGGVVRVGDDESISRSERAATVDINGLSEKVTFVFVTRWFTSSTGGCTVDEPMRALSEYDILDAIQR